MPKANIGIVGGGIGGVAAAVALHQAGIDAAVYERAPQLREVGAGMMGQRENRIFVAGRRVVTGLLPARLFEHNLRRVYSYEI